METLEEFAAAAFATSPELLGELEVLARHPEVAAVVAKWATEASERHRVAAVTSRHPRKWIADQGKWKALQEFADMLKVRLEDYELIRQQYRDAGDAMLRSQ